MNMNHQEMRSQDVNLCLNCNMTVVGLERYAEHCRSKHDNHLCLMCQHSVCGLDQYIKHKTGDCHMLTVAHSNMECGLGDTLVVDNTQSNTMTRSSIVEVLQRALSKLEVGQVKLKLEGSDCLHPWSEMTPDTSSNVNDIDIYNRTASDENDRFTAIYPALINVKVEDIIDDQREDYEPQDCVADNGNGTTTHQLVSDYLGINQANTDASIKTVTIHSTQSDENTSVAEFCHEEQTNDTATDEIENGHVQQTRTICDSTNSDCMLDETRQKQMLVECAFTCRPCSFYCNQLDDFKKHVNCVGHARLIEKGVKLQCFCALCCCVIDSDVITHFNAQVHTNKTPPGNLTTKIYCQKKTRGKPKQYKCKICWMGFEKETSKCCHELMHQSSALGKTMDIGIDAKYQEYLAILKQCRMQDQTKCPECGKILSRKFMYPHLRNHTHCKPFKCSCCDQSFASKNTLDAHVRRVHLGIAKKVCKLCGKVMSSITALKEHMTYIHPSDDTQQQLAFCDICGRIEKSQLRILAHKRREHGKVFVCTFEGCGFTTDLKCTLKTHMAIHSQERNHVCQICASSYKSKSNLRTHMLSHNAEKKFQCEKCDYKTLTNAKLKQHERTHTGEKPFKCQHCTYECSTSGNIAKHMKNTHKDLFMYNCKMDGCIFGTNTASTFRDHLVHMHQEYKIKIKDVKAYLNI